MSILFNPSSKGISEADAKLLIEGDSGYGFYSNTTFTTGNRLTIPQGNSSPLDFNNVIRETKLPLGVDTFFENGKLQAVEVDGTYSVRVGFWASPSINNGAFGVDIDISAAGDGSNIVAQDVRRMVRGNNTPQFYTIPLPIFTAETFVANKGVISFEAIDGDIDIYDLQLLVIKT